MGINYYPQLTTRALSPDGTSRYDWSGTAGFAELARAFYGRYGIPLFWTESSVAGSVEARLDWLEASIGLVAELRQDGIPIVGYTWWPLFSLVDWDYRETGRPVRERLVHMGLADLVPGPTGLERRETRVLPAFREVARRLGTPPDSLWAMLASGA
jgi:beta-glucosidase/6-phospho-beta-glucosidase/beta-galactosidase